MSGRAGRRGYEKFGSIVLAVSREIKQKELKQFLAAAAFPLFNQFHLTSRMILALFRSSQMKAGEVMQLSFHQFQQERILPEQQKQIAALKAEIESKQIANESEVKLWLQLLDQIEQTKNAIRKIVYPTNMINILRQGSIILANNGFVWGIFVAPPQKRSIEAIVAHRAKMLDNQLAPATILSEDSAFFMRVDVNDTISIVATVPDRVTGEFSDRAMTTRFRNLDRLIASGIEIVNDRSMITKKW
jgi:superfamily II RNA helicase